MDDVARFIGLASLHGMATLSMDDDVPEEMLWVGAGWFATAVMAWREV